MEKLYTARVCAKDGRELYRSEPMVSIDLAVIAAFRARPNAKTCSCGYGQGGSFDIRWYNRANWLDRISKG